jgi:exodeoxyribonuclease VII small subunit
MGSRGTKDAMSMAKTRVTKDLTFEQAFRDLEGVVQKLEAGDLSLEQSLELFERGQSLAAHCAGLLEKAELKLKKLVGDEAHGFVEQPMDLEEE